MLIFCCYYKGRDKGDIQMSNVIQAQKKFLERWELHQFELISRFDDLYTRERYLIYEKYLIQGADPDIADAKAKEEAYKRVEYLEKYTYGNPGEVVQLKR